MTSGGPEGRYMTLETMASLSDYPVVGLPAVATSRSGQGREPVQRAAASYTEGTRPMRIIKWLMIQPQPLRTSIRALVRGTGFGGPKFQFDIGAIERASYAYLVYNAAKLAHRLGHQRVSVLEFGVAAGEGLLLLERHADWVEKLFPVKIEVYGFDTGTGLPAPADYRDLQYYWKAGDFSMDQKELKSKLKRAKLVLGNLRTTAASFIDTFQPAPIGGVSHDLDFYSSTVDALKLFDVGDEFILPRVFCYFDDVLGGDAELYNDYTGERAAILDFNKIHDGKKLSPAYYLQNMWSAQRWPHQIWILHNFNHRDYGKFIGPQNQQLKLSRSDPLSSLVRQIGRSLDSIDQ
jgi:hypothetical protein